MFAKSLILNKLNLPVDLINMVKDYAFHGIKRIPKDDMRYQLLSTIPPKEYDPSDGVTFVYLLIGNNKDYFLTYCNFVIQLQTLQYNENDNMIYGIEGHSVAL